MRKTGFGVVGLLFILLLAGCGEVNIVTPQTFDEQLENDLEIVEQYRKDEGLTFVEDSVTYPVQYTILEEGSGKDINLGDIVFCHYIMRLSTGEVVNTSIDTVAIANDIYNENNPYKPIIFTFTETGWAISAIIPPTNNSTSNHEAGWRRGITAALGRMNVGGHALIASPSVYAYSSSVIIYEAYIINAK